MKALLFSISLLAMSFSSLAEDISENQLQRYIKALPAVVNWSQNQPELNTVDLSGMLGNADSSSVMNALGHIKEHELYTEFEALTKQYGFTPEQLVTVGSEVSMAYLENLKAGMSEENKQRVNQAMSGLQSLTASSSDAGTRSMVGALEGVKASTATADVSESNVNLVKQYMPQLKELFAMLQ
ncbi:short-chain dehydrogenase [uncultured Pseudoalteromonas sp.]|uniref:short-chain dehydrogenase n=1 Tax=uncultured Pseudoalteromonas sp. TaxID=114053 RepID=UPI000C5C2E93|nr:short-chain dehydrogenase [uncultured Pseudoalteromonas sp.]MBD56597.1 short-chain dehydrogenase [Pseudoalteromonas sp.]|tara:strand:- start:37539 stop:38087 length:549 start_codon:yes stop_codon:yes gene_type:complete